MDSKPETITATIDNTKIEVPKGITILEAATRHNIYIPTLCAHPQLTPFGGCRLCIVEVEKMRGLPTACTTPVEDGMVILTQTDQLRAERIEILRLILSEHPFTCLVCDERVACEQYSGTIRKAGVTTGCRYCPSDGQCELRDVVEKLGITSVPYSVYYRNLPIHTNDPFLDRDYNLCILCGRCVRVCQETRIAGTLAFKMRGPQALVGPAYDRTLREAGCEFCGACISVCPTGSLSEKVRKWKGPREREVVTTCAYCGVGCQISLQVKGNEVIGALPAEDQMVNNGQLCVKGRFCIPEVVGSYRRLTTPYVIHHDTVVPVSWDEANAQIIEKLSACPPNRFAMVVSANATNEDLYVAQKFTRVAMRSNNIETGVRAYYGDAFPAYLELTRQAASMDDLRRSSVILCIGLDIRLGRSVIGVELRQAASRGIPIVTINSAEHGLTHLAERWLRPQPGQLPGVLDFLIKRTTGGKSKSRSSRLRGPGTISPADFDHIAPLLADATHPIILVGSGIFGERQTADVLAAISRLAQQINARIMLLPAQNNLVGSYLMGAYPELLPGGRAANDRKQISRLKQLWGVLPVSEKANAVSAFSADHKLDLLYLMGEVPAAWLPSADFIIYQNILPPDPGIRIDLALPSAAFTEVDGTFINGEGRVQRVRQAVKPKGEALPDWQILCRIAQLMGAKGFDFTSAKEVHQEISSLVEGFGDFEQPGREARSWACAEVNQPQFALSTHRKPDKKEYPLLLFGTLEEHTYRGISIGNYVDGLKALLPTDLVAIHPGDAKHSGIADGEIIIISAPEFEMSGRAKYSTEQTPGTLRAHVGHSKFATTNPHPVRIRRAHV